MKSWEKKIQDLYSSVFWELAGGLVLAPTRTLQGLGRLSMQSA